MLYPNRNMNSYKRSRNIILIGLTGMFFLIIGLRKDKKSGEACKKEK